MKRLALLLVFLLLCTACAPPVEETAPPQPPSPPDAAGQQTNGVTPYRREPDMQPTQVLEAYLEQMYEAYTAMEHIDISGLLDLSQPSNRNLLIWLQQLHMRRRLLAEHDLCYVERQQLPYEIRYLEESELSDSRVEAWSNRDIGDQPEVNLHFVVEGIAGHAYPPMLAVNSQQTIRMRRFDGEWKITMHYYPGSVRRFRRSGTLTLPTEQEMLAGLLNEFATQEQPDLPAGGAAYDGRLAAGYAQLHTEDPYPGFYHIGDWMGNCANFTSQCVWYGFSQGDYAGISARRNMTATWYAGQGGGSPAWENVRYFWDEITSSGGLMGVELQSAGQLRQGDLLQTRYFRRLTPDGEEDEEENNFNHSLLVVEEATLLLAQNSPGCFVYYSDLVNVDTRMVRPAILQA